MKAKDIDWLRAITWTVAIVGGVWFYYWVIKGIIRLLNG